MPSISDFEVMVLGMTQPKPTRLQEYDVRNNAPPDSLTPTEEAIGQVKSALESAYKRHPSTCECYITSTPNQQFRIMFTNHSNSDACVAVFVDGEWIYSGLSYQPNHKIIYFSGRLIDENTIQEMRFVDLDTTC